MKDLITLHVALPDTIENGLVNFRKIAQLSLIFQELWELQNSVPKLAVNADLVNTLRVSDITCVLYLNLCAVCRYFNFIY